MRAGGLHIAGWNDIFLEGSLRNYTGLRTEPTLEYTRDNQYLVVGPWSRGNYSEWQGDAWHGYGAASIALDLTAIHLEFFPAILEHRQPNMPRVKYFTSGIDRWQQADDWPVVSRTRTLYLPESCGERVLADAPESVPDAADTFVSDPADSVPTAGGPTAFPACCWARTPIPSRRVKSKRVRTFWCTRANQCRPRPR